MWLLIWSIYSCGRKQVFRALVDAVIRVRKHISSFVGLPFAFHITFVTLSTRAHREGKKVTLSVFPFVLIPGDGAIFHASDQVFQIGLSLAYQVDCEKARNKHLMSFTLWSVEATLIKMRPLTMF